jgi:hypothetical protein
MFMPAGWANNPEFAIHIATEESFEVFTTTAAVSRTPEFFCATGWNFRVACRH